MAEVVRGGLQAMPKGQYEAAAALGLSWWRMQQKVILPQALTLVIPSFVNSLLSTFMRRFAASLVPAAAKSSKARVVTWTMWSRMNGATGRTANTPDTRSRPSTT